MESQGDGFPVMSKDSGDPPLQGEGAHYVYCTPRELDDIVDLDKQSLRKKRKETQGRLPPGWP